MTEAPLAVFVAVEQSTTFCNARFEASLRLSYGSLIDLECCGILRAFLLISHWIIPLERIFTEMDFTLTLNERPIAAGYIFKVSSYRKLP